MADIISESARIRQSITRIVSEVITDKAKSCLRVYKAQVKTAPNGSTCEVQLIGDDNTMNLPYSSECANVQKDSMVWVATLYDSFSNAIVWQPDNFNSMLSPYPVGAIYTSTGITSPAELFGGTWLFLGKTGMPSTYSRIDTKECQPYTVTDLISNVIISAYSQGVYTATVNGNIADSSAIMSCRLFVYNENGDVVNTEEVRTTLGAGGGCCATFIATPTDYDRKIVLSTYNYRSEATSFTGQLYWYSTPLNQYKWQRIL